MAYDSGYHDLYSCQWTSLWPVFNYKMDELGGANGNKETKKAKRDATTIELKREGWVTKKS